MPRIAFFKKLDPDTRRAFDNEIRRRGYGDCVGLSHWLAERGVTISKTVIGQYVLQLKRLDELQIPPPFSPESARALTDFAHLALLAKTAFDQFLGTLK